MYPETFSKLIDHTVFILKEGGIILYPADTIWGIGCDPLNPKAVDRIVAIKGRDPNKPFILLVPETDQLRDIVDSIHPRIDTLLYYHERPLTVIYPKVKPAYAHLSAKDGSIAVRVVKSGFCHELLRQFGKPLISTSANISGEPAPSNFGSVSTHIMSQVDYVLPAATEKDITGNPSVIARYDENGDLEFLRHHS